MSFLDGLLGRPNYKLLPGVQDSINSLSDMSFGLGAAGKSSKHLLKQLDRGDDVSNIGTFSPIRQEEAADLSDIDMDYSTGANVLNAAGGGEQANQINAMRDRAKEHRRETTGRQMVSAIAGMRGQAMDELERANQRRDGMELQKQGLLLDARRSQYNATATGGYLSSIIGGAAQAGGAFLGKPPSPCWIASALYGENDPRVARIRGYLLKWAERSYTGSFIVWLYRLCGERIAKSKRAVRLLEPIFNHWARKSVKV
jgi:hypothetical protein